MIEHNSNARPKQGETRTPGESSAEALKHDPPGNASVVPVPSIVGSKLSVKLAMVVGKVVNTIVKCKLGSFLRA